MIQSPSEIAKSNVPPVVEPVTIVGGGRVGCFFAAIADATPVTRHHGALQAKGPVLVCVRNNDLEGVILSTPTERRKDLIFIQNGMIDSLLQNHGLDKATRGILYFAIEEKGGKIVDGGGSVFCGDYAPWLVSLLQGASVDAKVVVRDRFTSEMGRKLIWNSVFGVLGEVYQINVAQTLDSHRDEFRALVAELKGVFESSTKIALGDDLEQALTDYAAKVSHYRCRASEWGWRNGWFLDKNSTPLHSQLSLKIGKAF
jgi:ketopantoate reductase